MNIAVYLFGKFNNGYTQYPDDYTKSKFQNFNLNAKSATQIAIHREENLMYYGYVRKLEHGHYIGFCVIINGLMLTKFDRLFSLYENMISTLVTNGQLIKFNEQGNIVTSVDRLYMNRDEIDFVTDTFRAGFAGQKNTFKPLPPVSYGMSKDSSQSLSVEDDIENIIKSTHSYGYTYIYKSRDFDTTQLNSYKGVLNRLYNEKIDLVKRFDGLTYEHEKTIKQKKQYRSVAILFLLVLGCLIGIFYLNNNLKSTTNDLNDAHKTINSQNNSINDKNSHIVSLEAENRGLKVKYQQTEFLRQQAETNFDSLQSIITVRQPFLIKSTSYNFDTGHLSFTYFGFKNESVTIIVRVYNDEGYSYSKSINIDLLAGDNVAEVYLNPNLNDKTWYSFEILKGDTILGGDRH